MPVAIDGLMCPVGGADVMGKVADLLGMAVANTRGEGGCGSL